MVLVIVVLRTYTRLVDPGQVILSAARDEIKEIVLLLYTAV